MFLNSHHEALMLQVFVSVWRVFRYHLGTVAFGSFIIALVQLIRLIMKYLEKKAKDVRRDFSRQILAPKNR